MANNRKSSADRSAKQKTSSRHPSVSSLYSRPNTAHRKLKPEKSPSTQILQSTDAQTLPKSVQISKAVEACIPKTRFSSQDRCRELRSYSSPRLKYFPVEKIKKYESPPVTPMGALIAQQNPREAGLYYVPGNPEQNNGQGDAAAATQSLRQHRPPQHVQSVSQQQVAPHQPIHQMNPQSESILPQQILAGQAHRPFVPHGPRDHSPQKAVQNTRSVCHDAAYGMKTGQPVGHQGQHIGHQGQLVGYQGQPGGHPAANQSMSTMDQARKPEESANATQQPDYDKQPIGGRNAANYRQMMTGQQPRPQSLDPNMSNMTPSNHEHLQNHYSRHFAQNPQHAYHQLQQNMQQQMQMQQRAMNYQMMGNQPVQGQGPYAVQPYGRYFSQGMTSPQDQMNMQRAIGPGNQMQRNMEYSMKSGMQPQNGWNRNHQAVEYANMKSQLKPFNVEVANNNQPRHSVHPYHHPMHQYRALSANPAQSAPMAYHQSGFDQQMAHDRSAASQPPENNRVSQNNKKKPLEFTASMLRDQEKLLATMKQQGVPVDIIRRHFDTLLNEQRKHLEYIEYLQRESEHEEVKSVQVNPRRRRNIDEKPEWMAHLTPSRMSYLEMERLREKQKREEEAERSRRQNTSEMADQQIPIQHQGSLHFQNPQPYQSWQPNWQQSGVPQPYNNMFPHQYVPSGSTNANAAANMSATNYQRHQVPQHQYVQQQQYLPQQQQHQYVPHQQQQQYVPQQQQQQYVPQQSREQTESSNEFSNYQQGRQPAEPSSLLKIRQYVNEIRPQKRNNGLQDPEVARKQLEELRMTAEMKKGLEYLASFAPKKPMLRLNGIQDRNETETEIQKRLLYLNTDQNPKKISANGLENNRNPDNPPPQRMSKLRKLEQEFAKEYPRQRTSTPKNCYSVQAERENGTVAQEQQPSYLQQQLPANLATNSLNLTPVMPRGNLMPYAFDASYPQHHQQMQQYYQNTRNLARNNGEGDAGSVQRIEDNRNNFERAGGDAYANMNGQMADGKVHFQGTQYGQPDIQEARTIGGIRYLARKQDYLPSQQMMPPETLISGRHIQPPVIY